MQILPLCGKLCNQYNWRHLLGQSIKVVQLKSILNYSSWKICSSYGLNTLGPLCLWQCLYYIANESIQTANVKAHFNNIWPIHATCPQDCSVLISINKVKAKSYIGPWRKKTVLSKMVESLDCIWCGRSGILFVWQTSIQNLNAPAMPISRLVIMCQMVPYNHPSNHNENF